MTLVVQFLSEKAGFIVTTVKIKGRIRKSCWLDDEHKATIRVLVTSLVISTPSSHALFLQ